MNFEDKLSAAFSRLGISELDSCEYARKFVDGGVEDISDLKRNCHIYFSERNN